MRWALLAVLMGVALVGGGGCQRVVHFTVDADREQRAISPYIYGVNEPVEGYASAPLARIGGNRWTAYNWVNNASNAGNDYHFQSDNYLSGSNVPGAAVESRLRRPAAVNAAVIVTVPINGYVAADKRGDGDVRTRGVDVLGTRFRVSAARKGGAFTLTPSAGDAVVYQDEFVNWLKVRFPERVAAGSGTPIWFALDNEPDLWASTHAVIHPEMVTYAEVVEKNIAYAAAIKDVMPGALVFGPVNYGWQGFVSLQHAPDGAGRDFQEVYLDAMRTAGAAQGRRLLDVFDVHWYPEARGGDVRITEQDAGEVVAEARMQAPRSLWDATYREKSWIVDKSLHAPIELLPRLQQKIDEHYPGTKLGVTEYNYGGGSDISGAIAQADVLGIFGRQGVFAACEWPLVRREPFIGAAFRMYRDFDGKGGKFGPMSVWAETDDVEGSSVYASTKQDGTVVLVAINKTRQALPAEVWLKHVDGIKQAEVHCLTASAPQPAPAPPVALPSWGRFTYVMPALSVSTIRLTGTGRLHW